MHDSEGIYSSITTTGFQFLLMDRQSQVWYFLLQYLKSVEASLVASSKSFRVFSSGGGGGGGGGGKRGILPPLTAVFPPFISAVIIVNRKYPGYIL